MLVVWLGKIRVKRMTNWFHLSKILELSKKCDKMNEFENSLQQLVKIPSNYPRFVVENLIKTILNNCEFLCDNSKFQEKKQAHKRSWLCFHVPKDVEPERVSINIL